MLNNKICRGIAAALVAVGLAACGGGGSSNDVANVRLLNTTLTHQSTSLLVGGSTAIATVPLDTVSAYAGATAGSPLLQINDATTTSALATLAPTVGSNAHYVLVAYEGGGAVRTAIINEDTAAPPVGTAALRVFNTATDAGAIDVYVTDPTVNIATPTFTFSTATSLQTSGFVSLPPGTYRIRVTGAGNPADLRLDLPSFVLTDQEVASAILTPTVGGTLGQWRRPRAARRLHGGPQHDRAGPARRRGLEQRRGLGERRRHRRLDQHCCALGERVRDRSGGSAADDHGQRRIGRPARHRACRRERLDSHDLR